MTKNLTGECQFECASLQAQKEKAAYEAALVNYVPSAAYKEAMQLVQNAKTASVAKSKQGNTKLKDKMKKHRMKVKALKSEISSIEKKMAKAQKLAEKLEIKQEHLEKAEIKLQEMAGPATGRIPVKPTIQKKTGKKKK
eukprot:SAG31_NODE_723_length_12568_cov_3.102494_12_plen_139_part_00